MLIRLLLKIIGYKTADSDLLGLVVISEVSLLPTLLPHLRTLQVELLEYMTDLLGGHPLVEVAEPSDDAQVAGLLFLGNFDSQGVGTLGQAYSTS